MPLYAFRVADETVYTRLRRFVLSLSTLAFSAIIFPIAAPWDEDPRLLMRFAVYTVSVCFVFALVAYAGSEVLARYEARLRLRRIFAGDRRIVPDAPTDATLRLVTAAFLTRRSLLPGILYVQPSQFLFQPHRQRSGGAIPEPVVIAPAPSITVSSAHLVLSRFQRLFWRTPPELIIVRWGGDREMILRVPFAASVEDRLQTELDRMRLSTVG